MSREPSEFRTKAGARKPESTRSASPFTRWSTASTIHGGVNISPWSAVRAVHFTKFTARA